MIKWAWGKSRVWGMGGGVGSLVQELHPLSGMDVAAMTRRTVHPQ